MRVVAGKARGRRLSAVPGDSTRPILDRVKTALFDTLRPEIDGISFLDLFGGSGGVGIEALSQGAAFCVFLDLNRNAVETIKKNLEATGLAAQAEVRQSDAFTYLKNTSKQFGIVFVAPPQYKGIWIEAMYKIAERPDLIMPGGLAVVQIDPSEYEPLELGAFELEKEKRYGNTMLLFYRRS